MEQSRNCTINNTEEMTEKQIDVSLIRVDSRFFLKVYYNVPYKVDTARGRDCLKC